MEKKNGSAMMAYLKGIRRLLYCSVIFLLFGCNRVPIDVNTPFQTVQSDVYHRTSQSISWASKEQNSSVIKPYIQNLVQHTLSSHDCIQIALLQNPRLQATYENLRIAAADLVQAGLFQNPLLGISLRFENVVDSNHIIEVGLIQNLLDILLKPMKKKLAATELKVIENEVVCKVLDLILNTKIAYYTLQALSQQVIFRKEMLKAQDARYEFAKRLFTAKNTPHLALSHEQALYEQAKIDLVAGEIAENEAKEKLQVLMGLSTSQIVWKIALDFDPIPSSIDTSDIESQVLKNSIDLQMARNEIEATSVRVGIETKELVFPQVGIGIDTEFDSGQDGFIGPQAVIPLPFFDSGYAKETKNHAEVLKLYKTMAALAIEIQSAARKTCFRLDRTHKQSNYYRDTMVPLKEAITYETLLQVNAMQMAAFDLLLAKYQELDTKLKATDAYKDFWITFAELEMLLNGHMRRL